MEAHQVELRRAMLASLNWRQPRETLAPILPPSRRPWWRRILNRWF